MIGSLIQSPPEVLFVDEQFRHLDLHAQEKGRLV